MNTTNLLNQLLKAGTDLMQNKGGTQQSGYGQQHNQSSNSQPTSVDSLLGNLSGLLSGKAGAALGGGALGLLLGSKKGRKMGGTVLTYGGLAALGVIAYKAYGNWQAQQNSSQQQANTPEPQTIDRIPPAQAEQHSRAILIAIIAAAKADGHVDERERQLIDGEIAKITQDPSLLSWVDQELKKPLDPTAIAAAASTPEIAAEMYLASILVVDEENFMERAYLQELAKQLRLDPSLQTELSTQAQKAIQLCQ
ncbi:tellurite resistance TerB family protein [Cellvibrio sp. NN19]|uniref:tellurite resistance TerB family protein n=1 Tax=Cellvibrio chitinivorans TaxID=3102792 RepID=UPI002B410CCA|nr:tellurite resistance TerB family protein [Cellvibrio sp. NN19]